jgi:hypothetical protein
MLSSTDALDADATRAELWRRYDAGLMSAEVVEQRLQLVDRAGGNAEALGAALDGVIPASRRLRAPRNRSLWALAFLVLAIGGVVGASAWYLSGRDGSVTGSGQSGSGFGFATIETLPGVGLPGGPITTVPPGDAASCVAADDMLKTNEGIERPPGADSDTPLFENLLTPTPPAIEGYEVVVDEERVGPESDSAWSIAAGSNPMPSRTWARTYVGDDTVEIRAFLYDNAKTALLAGRDTFVTGVCQFGTVPAIVDDLPGSYVVTSTTLQPTAYTGFTFGPVRVVVAAFNPDLEAAKAHAIAVTKAERDAWLAAVPPG